MTGFPRHLNPGTRRSERSEESRETFATPQNDNQCAGGGCGPTGSVGGFTFLEVLVALAIFGFTGMVLASAYLNVLSAQHASVQQDATAADRRLVRQALYAEPTLEKVTAWNDLELPEDRKAKWRATITPTKIADLFDVTLEIELPALKGGKDQTITETYRLLRPTWSQPADREALRTEARSKLAQRSF